MSTYTNNAQQRICRLVEELAGNEDKGLSLTELAEKLGISTSAVFRDLKNLEEAEWARQIGSNWAMAPRAAVPAVKIRRNLDSLLGKVNKINKDYLGGE